MTDPSYHFQEIPINQLQLRKLIAGRIDVVPMSLVTAFTQIREEGLEGKLDYLPKPLKTSPYFNVWTRSRADADTPALMAAYDAELLHMKRDGPAQTLYDKYGIPISNPDPPVRVSQPTGSNSAARTGSRTGEDLNAPSDHPTQGFTSRRIGFCSEISVSVDWISSMVWILWISTVCNSSMERVITFMKML